MMLASGQKEHYDYDNPSHSMSFEDISPRQVGSGQDIRDAGVIRPNMINILPEDDLPGIHSAHDEIMHDPLPAPLQEEKPAAKGSKLKGLFSKKKNKDKTPAGDGEEARENEDKKSGTGGLGKLKGMFKKKGGGDNNPPTSDLDPVVTTPESQAYDIEMPNPAYDPSNPNSPTSPMDPKYDFPRDAAIVDTMPGTPPVQTSTINRTKNPFSSLLRKPATQVEIDGTERLQLKPEKPESHFRCSNVLNVLLIFGAILGILFLALQATSAILAVIGPVFLGLSLFALVGKIFFTLFWQEDPLPRLKPYVYRVEGMLGPKGGTSTEKTVVIARSSMYGQRYGIPADEEVQIPGLQYEQYDEQIDTRLRSEDTQPKAPTFI